MSAADTLKELLGGPPMVAYYPSLAKAVGSIEPALFLQQICHWSKKSEDEWVFRTQDQLEEELAMSAKVQIRARRALVRLEVIEEKRRGQPARLYYKVNWEKLAALLLDEGPDGGRKPSENTNPKPSVQSSPTGESRPAQKESLDQPDGSNSYIEKESSNKNREKKARSKKNVSYLLSSEGKVAVDVLLSIDSWDKNREQTKELVATTIEMFPDIDVSLTAKNLAYKLRTKTCKQYKKPSQAFANWASADAQRATSTPEPSPQRRDSQTTRSKPIEVDYEKMEPAYTEIDRRRAEMRAEIIRRAEEEEKAKGVMSGE